MKNFHKFLIFSVASSTSAGYIKHMEKFITTPMILADFYKQSHPSFYKDVTGTYATYTPRKSLRLGVDKCVVFGIQFFLKELNDCFYEKFFNLTENEAVKRFDDFNKKTGNVVPDSFSDRLRSLHKLGYLPVKIKALKEGSMVDYNTPIATISTTNEEFFWIAQWLETWFSNQTWKAITSATTMYYFKQILNKYNKLTSDIDWITDFSLHDFSARGDAGVFDAAVVGAAHCLVSKGSDTCWVVDFVDYYYSGDNGLILTSVPASEHCGEESWLDPNTYDFAECDRLYTQHTLNTFPEGIVSQVSDGFDYYGFLKNILPEFKEQIMNRNGKFVIRPDSSPKTPVEVITGDPDAPEGSIERMGTLRYLYELFGGTVNSKGYIDIDSHIGLIYGEGWNFQMYEKVLANMEEQGFSSNNLVIGVGSGVFQAYGGGLYETANPKPWGISRDTAGLAVKATAIASGFAEDQKWKAVFKDPKTDNSGKKSHKGFIMIEQNGTDFIVHQDVTLEEEAGGALELVYENGKILRHQSFADVRAELKKYL